MAYAKRQALLVRISWPLKRIYTVAYVWSETGLTGLLTALVMKGTSSTAFRISLSSIFGGRPNDLYVRLSDGVNGH
jgi:hypothetical protein